MHLLTCTGYAREARQSRFDVADARSDRVAVPRETNMTVKLKLKDVKDKLKEDTLDLSLCDLEEVPVREIVSLLFFFYKTKWNT